MLLLKERLLLACQLSPARKMQYLLCLFAIPLTFGCNKTIEREMVIREPLPIIEVSQDYNQLKRNVEHYNLFAIIENNKLQDEYSKVQKNKQGDCKKTLE